MQIAREAPDLNTVATEEVRRDIDYGLAFYRNHATVHYGTDGVPAEEHVLVIRSSDTGNLDRWLSGRVYQPLFLFETQGLAVYRVMAKP